MGPTPHHWAQETSEPTVPPGVYVDPFLRERDQRISDVDVGGETFGKYSIVGELAVGEMAEVVLAVERGLDGFLKVVVLKRVLPRFSTDPEFVRMFIDEARLAARLEHPNLVRTDEFGEVNGQYFTTMEYLPGEEVGKTIRKLGLLRLAMPVNVAAGIISQVCAGLHFAHQLTDTAGHPLNLVHRDINPTNVIITLRGEVKIIDFGVAKTNESRTIDSNTIKGKVSYMSPEQLAEGGVDCRSDVFSTGIVLWELLTGKPLFMRDSEADPIPMPSKVRPDVPRELDLIVERALARAPSARFDSAEEMGVALEKFLARQPKVDARVLSRMVWGLFGRIRADAMRSTAQSGSIGSNVSLVMRLRTEVKADLMREREARGAEADVAPTRELPDRETDGRTWRWIAAFLALVILVFIAGGGWYLLSGSERVSGLVNASAKPPPAGASLQISSTPPGAAISIGGEPTGLKTPARLPGLTASDVAIRLELAGYDTTTANIGVAAGATLSKHFVLTAARGRLFITGLPGGAVVSVDGAEFEAGDLIDVARGTHDVRVVVGKRAIARQRIETTTGDQRWKLERDTLAPTGP